MPQKSKKTIGLGILSWNAHDTLRKSLESYLPEFLKSFDQTLIYFSDISDEDRKIAAEFGWECAGGPNEGIAGGMKRLSENLKTDYILLLQNDNPICEDDGFAINHIKKAVESMENGQADLARMRHRWKVGEGFADVTKYLKYYGVKNVSPDFIAEEHSSKKINYDDGIGKKIKRILKPNNAKRFKGRSVFIEKNPENIHPDVIQRDSDFLIIDSSAIDFTDQCLFISRDMWLNVFVPFVENNPASTRSSNGFQAPELCINGPWWRSSGFKILQGKGVFTHARYDGSFRENHHTLQGDKK
jgi:hypothetical protein